MASYTSAVPTHRPHNSAQAYLKKKHLFKNTWEDIFSEGRALLNAAELRTSSLVHLLYLELKALNFKRASGCKWHMTKVKLPCI